MAPGEGVSADRDEERCDMRAHLPPVGGQGHRAQLQSAENLNNHHERRQNEHAAGVLLPGGELTIKVMGVLPMGYIYVVHGYGLIAWPPLGWSFSTWAARSLYLFTISFRSFTLSLSFFTNSSRWTTSSFMASFCFWMPP